MWWLAGGEGGELVWDFEEGEGKGDVHPACEEVY